MIILVYDITNFASFERLFPWMQHIAKYKENPPFVAIFGNKCKLISEIVLFRNDFGGVLIKFVFR